MFVYSRHASAHDMSAVRTCCGVVFVCLFRRVLDDGEEFVGGQEFVDTCVAGFVAFGVYHYDGGNGFDVVFFGCSGVFVYVDVNEFHCGEFKGSFVEGGVELLAGAAPCCAEVDGEYLTFFGCVLINLSRLKKHCLVTA